jgi:hypothetical protein
VKIGRGFAVRRFTHVHGSPYQPQRCKCELTESTRRTSALFDIVSISNYSFIMLLWIKR